MRTDLLELLPIPTARDLPPGRLELHRQDLVRVVAADRRGSRFAHIASRLRRLFLLLLLATLFLAPLKTHTKVAVAGTLAVAAAAPAVSAIATPPPLRGLALP
jgi:hypothetical protein